MRYGVYSFAMPYGTKEKGKFKEAYWLLEQHTKI
jgi:hypothetical protein